MQTNILLTVSINVLTGVQLQFHSADSTYGDHTMCELMLRKGGMMLYLLL